MDKVAFSQALRNLLSNAVKYSEDRKEVEVRVRRDGEEVLVEVADRGVGLRPGDAEKIFDRFFRVHRQVSTQDGQRQRDVSGTGIGLAIVKHVVESHGGMVAAANRAGAGSRFSMRFPAARSS